MYLVCIDRSAAALDHQSQSHIGISNMFVFADSRIRGWAGALIIIIIIIEDNYYLRALDPKRSSVRKSRLKAKVKEYALKFEDCLGHLRDIFAINVPLVSNMMFSPKILELAPQEIKEARSSTCCQEFQAISLVVQLEI